MVCGRLVSSSPPDELARYFDADLEPGAELAANYNVAPTSEIFVVYQREDHRLLDAFRWGLVPSWAKNLSIGAKMINARAETLASKNAFRQAFARRRCIIPADGFYEWTKVPGHKKKQPWYIHRPDGEPYAFAGLWERWRPEPGQPWVLSCSIITGAANDKMAEIHDRMPIVLPPERWQQWLDPGTTDVGNLQSLLVPAPPELVTFHPVSTEVNIASNRGAHLIDAIERIDPDGTGTDPTSDGEASLA